MSLIKAYRIWETKKHNSDFKRIKISSSGSFSMGSGDLFENSEEVKRYATTLNASLQKRKENSKK